MIRAIISMLLLIPILGLSQHGIPDSTFKDVNKDGQIDTIETVYDGGSGFGGHWCTIIDGKTGDEYDMDTWNCFCDRLLVVPLPADSDTPSKAPFYKEMEAQLFKEFRDFPDPALDWLIRSIKSSGSSSDSSRFFDKIVVTSIKWHEGNPKTVAPYAMHLTNIQTRKYYRTYGEEPTWLDSASRGIMHFAGIHRYDEIETWEDAGYEFALLKTHHGLALKRTYDEQIEHTHVFLTDPIVTGGPEKLRWKSINEPVRWGSLLFFTLNQAPTPAMWVFAIDLKTGHCARFKHVPVRTDPDAIILSTIGSTLVIDDSEERLEFEMKEIEHELNLGARQ